MIFELQLISAIRSHLPDYGSDGGDRANIFGFLLLYDFAFQPIRNTASLCDYHAFQTWIRSDIGESLP